MLQRVSHSLPVEKNLTQHQYSLGGKYDGSRRKMVYTVKVKEADSREHPCFLKHPHESLQPGNFPPVVPGSKI